MLLVGFAMVKILKSRSKHFLTKTCLTHVYCDKNAIIVSYEINPEKH